MTLTEAVELIGPALDRTGGTWADFGAGTGLFTRALAQLLGPQGRISAVDRDARALGVLREATRTRANPGAEILPVQGDFRNPDAIPALAGISLDGALFANALHFAPDADRVLAAVAQLLSNRGRVVVVEYDGHPASRWVPYPVPVDRLRLLAGQAQLTAPRVVSQRPSAYGGIMYCAVLEGGSRADKRPV